MELTFQDIKLKKLLRKGGPGFRETSFNRIMSKICSHWGLEACMYGDELLCGSPQMTLPYSKCGRTSALYKSGNVLLSGIAKDFFINPNTDFPFLTATAVCL